jgi:hypothetical protein
LKAANVGTALHSVNRAGHRCLLAGEEGPLRSNGRVGDARPAARVSAVAALDGERPEH